MPDLCQCVKDTNRVFLFYEAAAQIRSHIEIWIDITLPILINIVELLTWKNMVNMVAGKRKVLEVIILTAIQMLWAYRNNLIFQSSKIKRIFEKIVMFSFDSFSDKNFISRLNWTIWLENSLFCNVFIISFPLTQLLVSFFFNKDSL